MPSGGQYIASIFGLTEADFRAAITPVANAVLARNSGNTATTWTNTPTFTSVNGLTVSTSTGTLTIANSKTLTASNTLTLTATDGSTLAIGAGGTLGTAAYTAASAYQPIDADLTTLASLTATTGNVIVSAGSAWTSATPDTAGLVAKTGTQIVGGAKTFSSVLTVTPSGATPQDVLIIDLASVTGGNNSARLKFTNANGAGSSLIFGYNTSDFMSINAVGTITFASGFTTTAGLQIGDYFFGYATTGQRLNLEHSGYKFHYNGQAITDLSFGYSMKTSTTNSTPHSESLRTWATSTHASRLAKIVETIYDVGTARTWATIEAITGGSKIGLLGAVHASILAYVNGTFGAATSVTAPLYNDSADVLAINADLRLLKDALGNTVIDFSGEAPVIPQVDPGSPADGMVWLKSGKIRFRDGGTTYEIVGTPV